eukprot:01684_3
MRSLCSPAATQGSSQRISSSRLASISRLEFREFSLAGSIARTRRASACISRRATAFRTTPSTRKWTASN